MRDGLTTIEVKQVRQAILQGIEDYTKRVGAPPNKMIIPEAIYTTGSIYTALIGAVASDREIATYFFEQLPENKRRIASGLTTKIGHPLILARSRGLFGLRRFEDMRVYALPEFAKIETQSKQEAKPSAQ